MSTELSGPDDPWGITTQPDGKIIVWCGTQQAYEGRSLLPDEVRRMARQLLMAAGPEETAPLPLLPMPTYDRTPDIRMQALDMAIRLARPGTAGHIITADAAAFEQYLTSGKVDSEQGE